MVWVRILLAACVVAAGGAVAAEEPPPPDPVRVRMLDDVPNYARILKDQWSTEIRRETLRTRSAVTTAC